MNLISLEFLVFASVLVVASRALDLRWQNRILLIGNLTFFLSWGLNSIGWILMLSGLCYWSAKKIAASTSTRERKLWLFTSLTGVLVGWGYFRIFPNGQATLTTDFPSIFMTIGVSFYSLQLLGYVIDVFRSKVVPASSYFSLLLFSSFFPTATMGPIERYEHLAPQLQTKRMPSAHQVNEGLFLISLGLFKKMVIADRIGRAKSVFQQNLSTSEVMLYLALYSIQIFCDFSGYTDIARGTAKLMGFDLSENFIQPYFARNIGDFWNRWNHSLTSWMRDYVYWPTLLACRNLMFSTFVLFAAMGVWHGFKWNHLLAWLYYFLLYAIYLLTRKIQIFPRHGVGRIFSTLSALFFLSLAIPIFFSSIAQFMHSLVSVTWGFESLKHQPHFNWRDVAIVWAGFGFTILLETIHRLPVWRASIPHFRFSNLRVGFVVLTIITILIGVSDSQYFLYMSY